MSLYNPGICGKFKIKETSTCSYRRKTFPGKKGVILIMPGHVCTLHSSCPIVSYWYAFFTLCSAPLKVVGRDFHWTLIFVLMFASIPVIGPMSAPLILAIKGLHNQQISSHISWHTQKEQSNSRLWYRTMFVQILKEKGKLSESSRNSRWLLEFVGEALYILRLCFLQQHSLHKSYETHKGWCAASVLVSMLESRALKIGSFEHTEQRPCETALTSVCFIVTMC